MRLKLNVLQGKWDLLSIFALILLAASVLLGGASRSHALRLAFVELAALPVIVLAVLRLMDNSAWKEHRFAFALIAGLLAIPLLQLLPLPPAIWTSLPGREEMVIALELSGVSPTWGALSLTPALTWRSILALLPPIAAFLAVVSLPHRQRHLMVRFYLVAAIASIVLGALQIASGGEQLYPWETTGPGSVTGFFANRNHLATFILVTIPFVLVLGAASIRRRERQSTPLWLAGLFLGVAIIALAMIRSRAGMTLFIPVVAGSLLAAWVASGRGRLRLGLLSLAAAVCVALTVVAVFALPPILQRFDTQQGPDGRLDRWPLVIQTADTFLPLGSGIGSFVSVYQSVEPLEELDDTYFNQAHNEYVESWLETGWLGAALLIAFLCWYVQRSRAAWLGQSSRERDVQRAATIGIGAVLLHSLVDYPLRTETMAVLFAVCCGFLELASRPDQAAEKRPHS